MASGEKLLERMRSSPHDWGERDFERLLLHFGFSQREGSNHTIYRHSDLPNGMVVTVPRHRDLRPYVARKAVRAVDLVREAHEEAGDE